jgi:hypothetical protein
MIWVAVGVPTIRQRKGTKLSRVERVPSKSNAATTGTFRAGGVDDTLHRG